MERNWSNKDAFGTQKPRYFHQNISTQQQELQQYVHRMGEKLRVANHFAEEYTYKLSESQFSDALVYGRLYSIQQENNAERISYDNCEIHFHPDFDIHHLKFDAPETVMSGMFKGQVIAAKGKIEKDVFHAIEVYTDCRDVPVNEIPNDLEMKIVVVSGPYFTNDLNVLDELNQHLKQIQCSKVIFLGPFVLANCPLLNGADVQYTPVELQNLVLAKLTDGIEHPFIIGSVDDQTTIPFIPHPPLNNYQGPAFNCSDPIFLTYKGQINMVVTAFDVPRTVSSNYEGPQSLRREGVANAIANQCCACPVMDQYVQTHYLPNLIPEFSPNIFISATKLFSASFVFDNTNVVYVSPYNRKKEYTFINIQDSKVEITFPTL